jgi:hypothetical protein
VPQAHYTVMVSGLPAGAYVEDIRQGGVSIYDTGLRVTSDPPGPIEVLVNSKSGMLEGNVANSVQQPAEGATVVLVPAVPGRGNAARYRTARSTQGIFRISGIPPGEYKLFAWESIPISAYMNAEYIAPFENRGVPVTIAAGSNQQANVTAIGGDSR